MTGTVNVVELGWWLGFSFVGKFAWACMEDVPPNLYRGVGGVRKD
jgi:hypothetical protein